MLNLTQVPAPRVPLIDSSTGLVSMEWFRFFNGLYAVVGENQNTLQPVNGGTGLSAIPTNGQLLIGNATGYTLNTLTPGAGISITNGAGSITLGGDARFVDTHFLSIDNRPGLVEPGYWLANAYVRFDAQGGRWYVQGGVKNLGDERYRTDGQEFSSVGNIQTVYYGDPRTWNVMVGFKF